MTDKETLDELKSAVMDLATIARVLVRLTPEAKTSDALASAVGGLGISIARLRGE